MDKPRILFVCEHNSGRSQIAEEMLRKLAGNRFDVESGGLEPREILPLIVEVLREEGIDVSGKTPRSVFDLYKASNVYTYVITVCSPETDVQCPLFPGVQQRLNWPFPDPADFSGSREEQLQQVRRLKEDITQRLTEFFQLSHNNSLETPK